MSYFNTNSTTEFENFLLTNGIYPGNVTMQIQFLKAQQQQQQQPQQPQPSNNITRKTSISHISTPVVSSQIPNAVSSAPNTVPQTSRSAVPYVNNSSSVVQPNTVISNGMVQPTVPYSMVPFWTGCPLPFSPMSYPQVVLPGQLQSSEKQNGKPLSDKEKKIRKISSKKRKAEMG